MARNTHRHWYPVGQQEYVRSLTEILNSWVTLSATSWCSEIGSCGCHLALLPLLTIQKVLEEAMWTSDAWLEEHNRLQHQPNESGCKFEKVILGLMLWSDSTHLANFGSVSVWPLYLYFGNLSKYFQGKPGSGASHHITYIPSVSTCLCDSSLSQYSLALTNDS